jgi:ubiquinone/menaquinone biosynthesis C-methylase UbiE
VTVDNNPRIIRAALLNIQRFGPRTRVIGADAFDLPFSDASFGVAVSQGLMEHFVDEQIAALIREQLRVCRSVVFSVPSDRYPRQDVGNERLLSPAQWQEIVEAAVVQDRYAVHAGYYGCDFESIKYSVLARRPLGSFSVLVAIDPVQNGVP